MELHLLVRGSRETQTRRYPLPVGRKWVAGRYAHLGGPLVDGRYLRTQGPLLDKDEYIPLEADTAINRYHFEVGRDEDGPWVRDRTSLNGTRLNGALLPPQQRHPLCPDDLLQAGPCVVRLGATAPVDPGWLSWNGGVVPRLARAIWDERAFDHLPILADALEEAGCTDADLLGNCRQPDQRARGCWVLALVLPGATQYCHLTARLQGNVLLVAIREGVFDAIPELKGPNPTERGVVEEFTDALSSSPAGVVLDIRSAGEINKRTLSLVLLLAGALSRSGLQRAICCTPGAAELLQVSRMTGVCPCYTDLPQALSSLGVAGG